MHAYGKRERIAFGVAGVLIFLPMAAFMSYALAVGALTTSWDMIAAAVFGWLAVFFCGKIAVVGRSAQFLEQDASRAFGPDAEERP